MRNDEISTLSHSVEIPPEKHVTPNLDIILSIFTVS